MADQNIATNNFEEEDEFLTDAEVAQRCRHEAAVTRLILSYVKKHAGWHKLRDVCHATHAFEKYGAGMCLEVTDALIECDELEQEMRGTHRYVRYNEEQA